MHTSARSELRVEHAALHDAQRDAHAGTPNLTWAGSCSTGATHRGPVDAAFDPTNAALWPHPVENWQNAVHFETNALAACSIRA
jgi:hypothetical protein